MMKALAAFCVVALTGCDLYFGGDDVQCEGRPKAEPTPPAYEVRDPSTGICTYGGGGGGGWCEDACGPCDYDEPAIAQDWGACYGECYDLDEFSCIAANGCYAAYINGTQGDSNPEHAEIRFWGCWNVAPSGPARGATCNGLNAYECSRHDDCSAIYLGKSDATNTAYEGTQFSNCLAERRIDPPPGECYGPVTCESPMPICPSNTLPGIHNGCYTGFCIPLADCPQACETLAAESACIGRPDCAPIYSGSNCTCDMTGCQCQTLTYERCETL